MASCECYQQILQNQGGIQICLEATLESEQERVRDSVNNLLQPALKQVADSFCRWGWKRIDNSQGVNVGSESHCKSEVELQLKNIICIKLGCTVVGADLHRQEEWVEVVQRSFAQMWQDLKPQLTQAVHAVDLLNS